MSRKKKDKQKPEAELEVKDKAAEVELETAGEEAEVAEQDVLEALQAELELRDDRMLRLQAEYENYRRRSREEMDRRYTDAAFDICRRWLAVLDNLDRALAAAEEAESPEGVRIAEGVALVKRQALEVMAGLGVEEIPALGEGFNPEWHEAVQHLTDAAYGENEVIDVLQKGYRQDKRVLRPAMVRVAN